MPFTVQKHVPYPTDGFWQKNCTLNDKQVAVWLVSRRHAGHQPTCGRVRTQEKQTVAIMESWRQMCHDQTAANEAQLWTDCQDCEVNRTSSSKDKLQNFEVFGLALAIWPSMQLKMCKTLALPTGCHCFVDRTSRKMCSCPSSNMFEKSLHLE